MVEKKNPKPTDQHVGKVVRARRTEVGLTQQELAEGLGVTFQQVQKYENASNRISASRLQQIANILRVPISYFFEGVSNGNGPLIAERTSSAWVDEFMTSADGQALARAFSRLKSKNLRKSIANLVEQLADDQE